MSKSIRWGAALLAGLPLATTAHAADGKRVKSKEAEAMADPSPRT